MSVHEMVEQINFEFGRRERDLVTAMRRELVNSIEDLESERIARLKKLHQEIIKEAAKEATS